ncbi:hypothetical protein ACQPTN_11925 [Bradyrhizobium sp. 13971]
MASVIGVTGLAFEARIAADLHTQAICSGDGSTLAEFSRRQLLRIATVLSALASRAAFRPTSRQAHAS